MIRFLEQFAYLEERLTLSIAQSFGSVTSSYLGYLRKVLCEESEQIMRKYFTELECCDVLIC